MAKNQSTTGITIEKPKAKTVKRDSASDETAATVAGDAHVKPGTTAKVVAALKARAEKTMAAKHFSEDEKKAVRQQHPTPAELASLKASVPVKKEKKEKKMGKRDAFGFGEKSGTSFLANLVATGKHTKAEVIDIYVKQFTKDDVGGEARKKITVSVFFSDITKPIRTYPTSRSLILVTDPKTNKISWEPKRLDRVRESIGQGLLNELKALNKEMHQTKINTVLKKYGLPLLEDAATAKK